MDLGSFEKYKAISNDRDEAKHAFMADFEALAGFPAPATTSITQNKEISISLPSSLRHVVHQKRVKEGLVAKGYIILKGL